MMKMQMHLDKTQVSGLTLLQIYDVPGIYSFDRSLYSMVGYTKFDMMAVGGAGGKSGIASGNTDLSIVYRQCGGGGGGSLRMQGNLSDLAAVTGIGVGSGGAGGTDSATVRGKAGDGGQGGFSNFGLNIAFGGNGGVGGNWERSQIHAGDTNFYVYTKDMFTAGAVPAYSKGGDGGNNNRVTVPRGTGGHQTGASYNDTQSSTDVAPGTPVAPTDGAWVVMPPDASEMIYSGGSGGGGGAGAMDLHVPHRDPQDGGMGAAGGQTTAFPDGLTTSQGGTGGGANIYPVTGVPGSYYGSGSTDLQSEGNPGVVVLKIS